MARACAVMAIGDTIAAGVAGSRPNDTRPAERLESLSVNKRESAESVDGTGLLAARSHSSLQTVSAEPRGGMVPARISLSTSLGSLIARTCATKPPKDQPNTAGDL